MKLIKPQKLKPGDTIASVSLSWGGAGDPDINWRYLQGKSRLEEVFGLKVVEMGTTLKGSDYVYNHPEERARDLMDAFNDPNVKGIFSCIGGDDSIRMLPYIDYESIRKNPKVFLGYSDTTITHLICNKAGISSFYGPSILAEMAENVEMHKYTVDWIKRCLFENDEIGRIQPPELWTSERLPWEEGNKDTKRKMLPNTSYELLQGEGIVRGRLFGGCVEVLEMAKGTEIWPDLETFKGVILFLETSEDMPIPENLLYALRNYGAQGILNQISGMIFGKPYHNKYYAEYKEVIRKVLKEYSLESLPVLYNLSFGHTSPMIVLPYGAIAEINCTHHSFSVLESGVL